MTTVHAFSNDVLDQLDGVALAEKIKNKDLSLNEVIEATIGRANLVEPMINAIETERYADALKQVAIQTPPTGFFAGIPTYMKDMARVQGLPTRFGSEAFMHALPATKNDASSQVFAAAGFNIIGKSTMNEFGLTATTEYPAHYHKPCRNPWNTNHSTGGSSGGAAALVASGVVPIANAADGGGSIRIPAGACGLVGLKPSIGRAAPSVLLKTQLFPIATEGVITRSVRDTAYFWAESEKAFYNPKLPKLGLLTSPIKRNLHIGYMDASINHYQADETSKAELQKTLHLLSSLGHTVKRINNPIKQEFKNDFVSLYKASAWLACHFSRFSLDPTFDKSKLTNLTTYLGQGSWKHLPSLLGGATRKRLAGTRQLFSETLNNEHIDLLLTPTVATHAPEIGYLSMDLPGEEHFERLMAWACFSPFANASGCPAISLPLGFDKSKHLPIGMMFWADFGQEQLLLELAYQLEQAAPWRKITDAQQRVTI